MIHQPLSPEGVHSQVSSSLGLLVLWTCSTYITVSLFFQRSHIFHWLPRQMAHQPFQRFG